MADYIRIPTFDARQEVVDGARRFTPATLRSLNEALRQIADAINAIAAIPEIQLGLIDAGQLIELAQTAADNANAAAAAAQGAADGTRSATALANSYPDNPAPFTVADAGTSVTITILAHNRIYGDGTTVAVDGGVLTGLPYDTGQYVFYSDPTRAGGAVIYQVTTNPLQVAQTGGIHSVGYAPPVDSGEPEVFGGGVRPPGGSYYNLDSTFPGGALP